MDQEQLDYFRQRLLSVRQDMEREIDNLNEATAASLQDAEYGVSNHMADEATDIYEREKNMALVEDRRQLLEQVDAALARVDDGTYGICLRTGKPIALERLEVLPYAAYSIEAQRMEEA